MDGDAHRTMREAMARAFAAIRQPQLAVAKEFLAAFGATRLRPGSRFDLMDDLARPMFKVMSEIAMTARQVPEAAIALVADVPLLFSPFTALKTRLEINERLGVVIAEHGEEIICDLGLLVLGVRPLTGGVARSLHATISSHQGGLLSAMPWPARLILSPVTYVDRICLEPMALGGEEFRCRRSSALPDPGSGMDRRAAPGDDVRGRSASVPRSTDLRTGLVTRGRAVRRTGSARLGRAAGDEAGQRPVRVAGPMPDRDRGLSGAMIHAFLDEGYDQAPEDGDARQLLFVCTTPRTGSDRVGRALYELGLGVQAEYFHPNSFDVLGTRWGMAGDPRSPGWLAAYWQEVRRRRTRNGVVAVSIFGFQLGIPQAVDPAGRPSRSSFISPGAAPSTRSPACSRFTRRRMPYENRQVMAEYSGRR